MRGDTWRMAGVVGILCAVGCLVARAGSGSAEETPSSHGIEREAILATADADRGALLGAAVDVEGDTALVGARFDPSAYIFTRDETGWTLRQKLPLGDAADRSCGDSVAMDGGTAVVGCAGEEYEGSEKTGEAYTFRRVDGLWHREQRLVPPEDARAKLFGAAVAIDGDTAAVGASATDRVGAQHAGDAYVFGRQDGEWRVEQRLVAPDPSKRDTFGASLALDDGILMVGAFRYDGDGVDRAGAVFLYEKSGQNWHAEGVLTASESRKQAWFGRSIALDGETALIGAEDEKFDGMDDAGAAYVFSRRGGRWRQVQRLVASDAEGHSGFGSAVALEGARALVGSWSHDVRGDRDGAAYVFVRAGDEWVEQRMLSDDDPDRKGFMGLDVALDGSTALVGVPGDYPGPLDDTGSVFVYDLAAE